jgi:hypothetical protein
MAQAQNTINEIILGNAVTTETTLDAFMISATVGEIGVFAYNGTEIGAGKDFVFAQKTPDSTFVSDVIKADSVKDYTIAADAPEVAQVVTIAPPAAAAMTVGAEYIVRIHIFEHGSLSVEDTMIKFGSYRTVTAPTENVVIDGLITSLNRQFANGPGANATSNPLFTFTRTGTGTTARLVITQKLQPYLRGKKFGRVNPFAVFADFTPNLANPIQGTVLTPYSPGRGTGKLVAAMEYDLRKNRGDIYGDQGWPFTFPVQTNANAGAGYNMLTLVHSRGHDGFNPVNMRKQITIAITESLSAGLDNLVAKVNTLTGKAVAVLGQV